MKSNQWNSIETAVTIKLHQASPRQTKYQNTWWELQNVDSTSPFGPILSKGEVHTMMLASETPADPM